MICEPLWSIFELLFKVKISILLYQFKKITKPMNKIASFIVYLFSASILVGGCDSSTLHKRKYSPEIDSVLVKAGSNHVELEKALDYFL